jgi:hypothetical protein
MRIVIDVSATTPPQGYVHAAGGPSSSREEQAIPSHAQPFGGWLGLLRVLAEAIAADECTDPRPDST